MEDRIIESTYSVSEEEAKAAYKLTGEDKKRFQRNRNTTVWFLVIMLLFGINIFRTVTSGTNSQNKYALLTYIAFEVICLIFIAVTWLGGRSVVKNAIADVSDGTKINLFINPNGISVKVNDGEERVFEKGNFAVLQDEKIFLILLEGNKKLVIPKRVFDTETEKTVSEYLA